jgi:hypothetical protein
MDVHFDLRDIERTQAVPLSVVCNVDRLPNRDFTFSTKRQTIKLKLPSLVDFTKVPEPSRVMNSLEFWSRVYKYPNSGAYDMHVLATAETTDGMHFFRTDFKILPKHGSQLFEATQVENGAILTTRQCALWLLELRRRWSSQAGWFALRNPATPLYRAPRFAWIGHKRAGLRSVFWELETECEINGAEIVHIEPINSSFIRNALSGHSDLTGVFLWRRDCPNIKIEEMIPKNLKIPFEVCDRVGIDGMIQSALQWIETYR